MNKKIILCLLILVCTCAVSHVSAADGSDYVASDNFDVETQVADDDVELSNEDVLRATNDDSIGNQEYREIQYLIDNADDGDEIDLEAKNYTCDYLINVNKSVTINGHGAVIKSNKSSDYQTAFINVEASKVTLKNIKFVGGLFLWGTITWIGDDGSIENCEFIDNIAQGAYAIGGALLMNGTNCNLTDCTFINNEAQKHGGAIIWNGDGGTIRNCEFRGNKVTSDASHGGALALYASDCIIDNCSFTGNHGTGYGGAISFLNNINNTLINCNFNENYVTGKKNFTNESDFTGGGAVFSICMDLVIDNCSFIGNSAPEALGGAVNLGINNTVKNSFFKDNSALYVNDIFATESSIVTSNDIILAYAKTVADSVYGLDPDELEKTNNFTKTKYNSSVSFSAGMVFEYGASGSIHVIVDGGVVELSNIRVLNHPEAVIGFANDVLTVSGLDVGTYTLRVTTTPDENHYAVDGDLSITVNKATSVIQASTITVALNKGAYWNVMIVDSRNGAPISGMEVTLSIYTGSKVKNVVLYSNANGAVSYQTKGLSKGTHKVVISATHSGYNFNTVTSSIKVIKQKALTIKIHKRTNGKKGSLLSFLVLNKKTKKGMNGVKIKLLIYTGKKYKVITLKTKKVGKFKGAAGYSTNKLSVGKHKVKIVPASIAYSGSKTTSMIIKKSAKKVPAWETKVTG